MPLDTVVNCLLLAVSTETLPLSSDFLHCLVKGGLIKDLAQQSFVMQRDLITQSKVLEKIKLWLDNKILRI